MDIDLQISTFNTLPPEQVYTPSAGTPDPTAPRIQTKHRRRAPINKIAAARSLDLPEHDYVRALQKVERSLRGIWFSTGHVVKLWTGTKAQVKRLPVGTPHQMGALIYWGDLLSPQKIFYFSSRKKAEQFLKEVDQIRSTTNWKIQ